MSSRRQRAQILELLDRMHKHESWCGETHVQKCAYFLQVALDVDLGVQFVLYKHGPFSFELHELLGQMRAEQLIELQSKFPYGPSIVETALGRTLRERLRATVEPEAEQIEFVAEKLGQRTVAELERVGTALYVRGLLTSSDIDGRAEQIVELKPHISQEAAYRAAHEVEELLAEAKATGVLA